MVRFSIFTLSLFACLNFASWANAAGHTTENAEDIFLPENAILDTSILFAIGAREAQQELRGSYGWDTFQEGLVEGVYFRFDPDGYARFSPNARLDSDLFEVICRPRTLNCVARKGPFAVVINGQGMLQLSIEEVAPGDQFFITDAINEIELPDRILQPLDPRFENVLAIGGDLIVRRGQNEVNRISLVGFSAVTSYLRWILAEQDYLALPRNWPVPNGNTSLASAGLTAPGAWRNSSVGGTTTQIQATNTALNSTNEAAQTNLASLRALVDQISSETAATESVETKYTGQLNNGLIQPDHDLQNIIARLEKLEFEIQALRFPTTIMDELHGLASANQSDASDMETTSPQSSSELVELATKIQSLTDEFGIDPAVAALLLRLQKDQLQMTDNSSFESVNLLLNSDDQAIDLTTLISGLATESDPTTESRTLPKASDEQEFLLLTDYFKSVSDEGP